MTAARDGAADEIARRCKAAGIDLCARGDRRAYDAAVDPCNRLAAPSGHDALLVLANSRALWEPFKAWLDGRALPREPVDSYVRQVVGDAIAFTGVAAWVGWTEIGAVPVLSVGELCRATGLASVGPAHLCAHPLHGPWFAVRAAVVLAGPGWTATTSAHDAGPCKGCDAPCAAALSRVQVRTGEPPTAASVAANWRAWVAVRDACPVGRASRYAPPQLRYHYTGDRAVLASPP